MGITYGYLIYTHVDVDEITNLSEYVENVYVYVCVLLLDFSIRPRLIKIHTVNRWIFRDTLECNEEFA